MVGGFHREVKYKGLPFMIEVEDKGLNRACIVTRIFFQGSLVVQEETTYADIIKFERLNEVLRELLFEIYRQTYKKLLRGEYDKQIKEIILKLKEKKQTEDTTIKASAERFIEKRVLPEIAETYADKYTITKIWDMVKSTTLKSYKELPEREKLRLLCKDIFAQLPESLTEEDKEDLIIKWTKEMAEYEKDNSRVYP